MDPRETYAWLLFIGMSLALFALSTYLFASARGALTADLGVWVGAPFQNRPHGELLALQWLGVFGMLATFGSAMLGVLGAFVRAKGLIR